MDCFLCLVRLNVLVKGSVVKGVVRGVVFSVYDSVGGSSDVGVVFCFNLSVSSLVSHLCSDLSLFFFSSVPDGVGLRCPVFFDFRRRR